MTSALIMPTIGYGTNVDRYISIPRAVATWYACASASRKSSSPRQNGNPPSRFATGAGEVGGVTPQVLLPVIAVPRQNEAMSVGKVSAVSSAILAFAAPAIGAASISCASSSRSIPRRRSNRNGSRSNS